MRLAFIFAALLAASPASAQWQYYAQKDGMTGAVMRFASVRAEKPLQFRFPYSGGSVVELHIKKAEALTIHLVVDQGQFLYNSLFRVKFDDGPVQLFDCREPHSGNPRVIFIDEAASFLAQLKRARRLLIEATFYQEGSRQIAFNVEGLRWKED